MKVLILEDHGIYKAGQEVEMARAKGEQWIVGGFAEYVPPAPKAKPKPKVEAKPDSLYADLTVKELDADLKERELSTNGKKEDKVARLEENDLVNVDGE